jgi:hypothetical protein
VIAGYKPDEIRNMIPKDTFIVFDGWNAAYSAKPVGSDAPSLAEARDMAMRYH